MFKSSRNKIWIGLSLLIFALVILNLVFSNNTTTIITAVLSSIIASIVISIYYNEELHNAINTYNRIGLKNYYSDFEMAQEKIRGAISRGKDVDIFVMYASSFFGSSTMALKDLLSRRETRLRIFLYHSENKFIESYGHYWGTMNQSDKYSAAGLQKLILNVKSDLKTIYQEIDGEKGVLEIFEIINAPISYSFYRIDDCLFYVPSKNTKQKNFKPPVFFFSKTKDENGMFSKVESELSSMINSREVVKLEEL